MSKVADAGAEALHAALSKPFVGLPFSRALVLSIAMRGSLPAATRSTGSARGHAAEALGLGWLSGFVTRTSVKTWYKDLKKPELVPPNWLFPVAWTTLYIYMGIASYRVYMAQTPRTFDSLALKLYAGQLTLNLLWTPLFFYLWVTFACTSRFLSTAR